MTDKERLLELLASYRIVPELSAAEDWQDFLPDAEFVTLRPHQGGVLGWREVSCSFVFRAEDGSFAEVGIYGKQHG